MQDKDINMDSYISNNHHSPVEKQEEDECPDELEYFEKKFLKSIQKRYGHQELSNQSFSRKRYNTTMENSMTRDEELEYLNKQAEKNFEKFLKSIKKRYGHEELSNQSFFRKRYNTSMEISMTRDEELENLSKQAEKNFASIKNTIRDEELEKLHQRSKRFLAWRDEQRRKEHKCDSSGI